MSIIKFIKRVCVQTAVLWVYLGPDGYGGELFAEPVEIKVRWEDIDQTMEDDTRIEFVSRAKIMLTEDVKMKDYLYLGNLVSINNEIDPRKVERTFPIKSFRKVPLIFSTDEFVKTAYL